MWTMTSKRLPTDEEINACNNTFLTSDGFRVELCTYKDGEFGSYITYMNNKSFLPNTNAVYWLPVLLPVIGHSRGENRITYYDENGYIRCNDNVTLHDFFKKLANYEDLDMAKCNCGN